MIDDQDRRILRHWQNDPNMARKELAQNVGVSLGALNRRIERLRSDHVLGARKAVIDWGKLGYAVHVFLRVTLDKTQSDAWGEFLKAARDVPEITVIETLVGRVDVRMDVRARDLEHYQEIYVEKILALPHLSDVESLMLISEIKNSAELPI